jgi:hypothetical protein
MKEQIQQTIKEFRIKFSNKSSFKLELHSNGYKTDEV